ncbi:MAG: CoA-transferase [Candidatus Bathyarchaeota archaeon]
METKYSQDYTLAELMAVAASREIQDKENVFIGIGVPLMAGLLAKNTHAPNITLIYESGCVGPLQQRISYNVGDSSCTDEAVYLTSQWRIFSDLQKGYIDVGLLGGAQIDKYGNMNTTTIFGVGTYEKPQARLPGSGGGNDIGSSAKRTVFVMSLEKRRFLPRVDYITTPGYLDGGSSREKAGLLGKGPVSVITNKCILKFDEDTKEMYLESLHPKVTIDEVKQEITWDINVAPELKITEPPTVQQVKIIRDIDPSGIILGVEAAISDIKDFSMWADITENSIKKMREMNKRELNQ